MRLIVCGPEDFSDYDFLCWCLNKKDFPREELIVLSDGRVGSSRMGELWAVERNVPFERFPLNEDSYGAAAQRVRVLKMVRRADAVVSFWDGRVGRTQELLREANRKGIHVHVFIPGFKYEKPVRSYR